MGVSGERRGQCSSVSINTMESNAFVAKASCPDTREDRSAEGLPWRHGPGVEVDAEHRLPSL